MFLVFKWRLVLRCETYGMAFIFTVISILCWMDTYYADLHLTSMADLDLSTSSDEKYCDRRKNVKAFRTFFLYYWGQPSWFSTSANSQFSSESIFILRLYHILNTNWLRSHRHFTKSSLSSAVLAQKSHELSHAYLFRMTCKEEGKLNWPFLLSNVVLHNKDKHSVMYFLRRSLIGTDISTETLLNAINNAKNQKIAGKKGSWLLSSSGSVELRRMDTWTWEWFLRIRSRTWVVLQMDLTLMYIDKLKTYT